MNRLRRNLLLVLATAIPLTLSAQLNPTVKVRTKPVSPVPAECDQGLAPQPAQRLTTEERTIVRDTRADLVAPPSAGLRSELQTAVVAAQHNNRDAFRDALARARDTLSTYPPGAERDAATELMNVLSDVDTVWSFQFASPTGAFFDASSDSFRLASRYSGYDAFIRSQVIVDQNGNRFYPTRETLDFLAGEAASRLSRLTGKPAPPRPAPRGMVMTPSSHRQPVVKTTTTPATATTKPATTKTTTTKTKKKTTTTKTTTTKTTTTTTTPSPTTKRHVARQTHPKRHTAKAAATKHVQPVTPASKHEATKSVAKREPGPAAPKKTETVVRPAVPPTTKHEAPTIVAKKEPALVAPKRTETVVQPAVTPTPKPEAPKVAKREPAPLATTKTESVAPPAPALTPTPAPSTATTTTATTAATTPSTTTTASAPTITTPTDTMSSMPATATVSTASNDTSATTSAEPLNTGKPAQSRSFFWPIFLIIVGLGVLVMLWRASS